MPLSNLQSDILRLLAAQRNPESYVAGSTPLNRDGPRFSGDIDIFHDREESVAVAADAEAFARAMPAGKEGLLFLRDGEPVQPDPARLGRYTELAGKRHAVWPGSSEIGGAMLERYGLNP